MKAALIMALMLTPCLGMCAGWAGFPMAQNTNNYSSWAMNNAYTNIDQLWQAASERVLVSPGHRNRDGITITDELTVDIGSTNWVSAYTNSGAGYTNIYGFTNVYRVLNTIQPVWYPLSMGSNMTLVSFVYTNLAAEIKTGTAFTTHSVDEQGGWQRIVAMLFNDRDSGADANRQPVNGFVITNFWDGDDYETYFALSNGPTVHPLDFPMYGPSTIFAYKGVGYTTNLDGIQPFGIITPKPSAALSCWFTGYTNRQSLWALAENVITNTSGDGTTHDIGKFGRNIFDSSIHPVLIYTGTNAGNITIQGSTISITNYAKSPWGGQVTNPASEIVAVSGPSTNATTSTWYQVTNISTLAGQQFDALTVAYTSPITLYYTSPTERQAPNTIIDYTPYDELQTLINAMRHTRTNPANAWLASPDPNNQYVWLGSSPTSWADAKQNCEDSVPTISTVNSAPRQWTWGTYNGSAYSVKAICTRSRVVYSGIPTNYARPVDLYIRFTDEPPSDYDAINTNYISIRPQNRFIEYQEFAASTAGAVTSTAQGVLTFPTTLWVAEPAAGVTNVAGYSLDNLTLGLLRWDADAAGFKYD